MKREKVAPLNEVEIIDHEQDEDTMTEIGAI